MKRILLTMRGHYLGVIMGLFLVLSCQPGQKGRLVDASRVSTAVGHISGRTTDDRVVKIFMGIPFAAPPLGELRWKAPQPMDAWEGVRACVNPPASAMQAKPIPFFCWSKEFLIPDEPIDEDCLYLNVWTTARTDQDKLPVIVWIHGGGFSGGSGTVPLYDGEAMARKGVVFVTINYRLGILGFLAHPDLSAESSNQVSGNYGILDQIAALKWVQENIAAFGGDPSCVTIAGQSAGSFSVNMLVASPMSKGLFARAIAQSGGMFNRNLSRGLALQDAEKAGKQLTDRLGVSIADLRNLPADSLMRLPGRYTNITVDNVVIPDIRETFANRKQNDVPLISGWNADDGVSFAPPASKEEYIAGIKRQYRQQAEKFFRAFPAITDEEAYRSQRLISSLSFGWNNYTWAKLQTQTGSGKAYLYYFTYVPPGEPDYGAFHSAEFGYALHTLKKWDRPFTETDYQLEDRMSSYWVNFAKNGDPNGEGLPLWQAFDNDNPKLIELGEEIKAYPVPFLQQLHFLDQINE
ncbi:Fumonisin B1 esterase [termite gut metagenome]|uniref:Fumonisin B1 esterase n=1 Tax=termite gut metagenome TaxID=433724 RepID=A0A5J4RLW0_9ZZZZ